MVRRMLALPLDEQRAALFPFYEAAYARYGVDWETNTALMAPDYVFEKGGTSSLPGLPERIEGAQGYVEAQKALMEVVPIVRVAVDDVIPLGENRVAVLSRFVLESGIEQQLLELHEFSDGLLRHQLFWFDREEGLRDVGVSR